jgi:phage-related holin
MYIDFKEKTANLFVQFLAFVGAFMLPIVPLAIGIIVLVAFDYFTGIKASRYKGVSIRPDGWKRSLSKIWLFLAALVGAHVMDTTFIENVQLLKILAAFIALMEFKSVLNNVSAYSGIDYWNMIWERVAPVFKIKPKNDNDATDEKL